MRTLLAIIVTITFILPMKAADRFVSFTPTSGFVKVDVEHTSIVIYKDEDKAIHHATGNLSADFQRVTDIKLPVVTVAPHTPSIVVGIVGSPVLKAYQQNGIIPADSLRGKWEKYIIAVTPQGEVVIAGSDRRGCIYGIYEFSRQIGVTPWYWWADMPVAHHKNIYLKPGTYTDGEPKVKYRGIFINDENPCMQQWARAKFGGMNSQMYAHVYELLLRMKANLLWPGMWGSFKEYKPLVPVLRNDDGSYEGNCFNEDDPRNPQLADEMGIVVGTSHHEPMQRSQQEWIRHKNDYGNGQWNYLTNPKGLQKFFRQGIEHTKDYESLITVGMRGDEDRPMDDAGGKEANMQLLHRILKDQRRIIAQVTGRPAHQTPQVWTLYSEMLDYYDDGMDIPDDVTIMLCDDNWGDVRKVPTADIRSRKGGFGLYYHFSYYGAPRAMKWLQQMQAQHVWQQLNLAYENGIDRIWIVNVGDIKPAEFMTQFFMDMAWDPTRFQADNLMSYTTAFCSQFTADHAPQAASILNQYNKYAARVTAEMLDEHTYNLASGEWKQVRDEFLALEAEALRLKEEIADEAQPTYNQIILYPVQALANLYDLYYSVAMNHKLYDDGDVEANMWADKAEGCFRRDSLLSHHYNKVMADGKWDHMMDEVHIGYFSWHAPRYNAMPVVKRLSTQTTNCGGYVYKEQYGQVVMDARKYYSAQADNGMEWTVIPDLGKTSSALALMPTTQTPVASSLSYKMEMAPRVDTLRVHLVFSTVMPFIKGGHDVEVSFDDGPAQRVNLNKDMDWQHCYDLMYPAGAARVIEALVAFDARSITAGTHLLHVRPMTQGLVLQRIIIDNGGYRKSLLFGKESVYCRECNAINDL